MLIKVLKATTMCMYVVHWNIFMVNKRDLQKNIFKKIKNYSYLKFSVITRGLWLLLVNE